MKKKLLNFMVFILAFAIFIGCSPKPTPAPAPEKAGEINENVTEIAKIGLGQITKINESKDLGVDKDGNEVLPVGQVDTAIAAVGFNKDGKVAKITIDSAQTKVEFNKDLTLKSDPLANYKTKVELGDEYGMVKASGIGKEWYQQAEALEQWMIGKTVDEIKSIKVKKKDEAHPAVPDVPELTSLVTISIQDYIAAVEEAYAKAMDVKPGAQTLGLGTKIAIGKSMGLVADKDGKEVLPLAQVDTAMVVAAFDKDGKVAGTIIDNAQTRIEFNKEGKVTTDRNAKFQTKVELGDKYGMLKASGIKKEWYQQAAELGKWMTGKTVDEIKSMKVKEKDEEHPAIPDVPELTSLVTISVQDYIDSIEKAHTNAK